MKNIIEQILSKDLRDCRVRQFLIENSDRRVVIDGILKKDLVITNSLAIDEILFEIISSIEVTADNVEDVTRQLMRSLENNGGGMMSDQNFDEIKTRLNEIK